MTYEKEKTFEKAEQELTKTVEEKEEKRNPFETVRIGTEVKYRKLFANQTKEIMYFIMKDGSTLNVTSDEIGRIKGKVNVKIKDIKAVIHNHPKINKFSKGDKDFHSYLREKGFEGKFLLYTKGWTYGLNKEDLDKPKNK